MKETPTNTPKLFYTPHEFADMFAINVRTVYDMVAAQKIASIKITRLTRIPASEVERIQKAGMK